MTRSQTRSITAPARVATSRARAQLSGTPDACCAEVALSYTMSILSIPEGQPADPARDLTLNKPSTDKVGRDLGR